jgi:hypothetical protein
MKTYFVVVSFCVWCITSVTVQAETDLTGTWTGQFKSFVINAPRAGQGPYTYRPQEAGTDPTARRTEGSLTITIDAHEGGLVQGSWGGKEAETGKSAADRFVCAEVKPNNWHCVDDEGNAMVEVLSANEMKSCYFGSKFGLVAGCAMLKKSE